MLIIIHNEWLYVQKISSKTVWWVMIFLLKQRIEDMEKWIFFDTIGKVVGLVLSATIFPPAMPLSVLLPLVVLVIPRQQKED